MIVDDVTKPVKPTLANATGECSVTVTAPTTTDNCVGTVTGTTTDPLTYTSQGTYTITWSFDDGNGNIETASQTVIVDDVTKPTITCVNNQTVNTDAGQLYYTAPSSWNPVLNAGSGSSFSDNCTGVTISYSATGAGAIPSSGSSLTGVKFNFGLTTVTWTATDIAGNTSTCTFTVNVDKVITDISVGDISVTPSTQKYSDRITLSAKVSPWTSGVTTLTGPSGSVEFYVQGEKLGTSVVGQNGVAILSNVSLLESQNGPNSSTIIAGQPTAGAFQPGIKNVEVRFISSNPDYSNKSATLSGGLTITPEDAIVDIDNTGTYFTADPKTNVGEVWFKAIVEDPNDGIGSRGDIRNATVQFVDGVTRTVFPIGSPRMVSLINQNNNTRGSATYTYDHNLSNAEISRGGKQWLQWAEAGNYYTGSDKLDLNVVTLALTGSEYVSGGGHYIMQNSSGIYAGTTGKRMNFGFNMRAGRSRGSSAFMGQINIVYRRIENGQEKIYHIKSDMIDALTLGTTNFRDIDGSTRSYNTASIVTKANMSDITSQSAINLGDNLMLRVVAWDLGQGNSTGTWDKFYVELYNSANTQLLYSSMVLGSQQRAHSINGGNINVRNTGGGAVATCITPTGLQSSSVGTNSAQLRWSTVAGASTYMLQYRIGNSGNWITNPVNTTSFMLAGLSSGVTYQWRIGWMCNGVTESWSPVSSFTTCTSPVNLNVTTTATSARFSWIAPAGSQLRLEYKLSSSSRWTIVNNVSSGILINRLRSATTYNWRLGYLCNGVMVYVNGGNFTPGVGNTVTTIEESTFSNLITQEAQLVFKVYPNPTTGEATLELNGFNAGAAEIRLLDSKGRMVLSRKEQLITGRQLVQLRLVNLVNGYYILQVIQDGKFYSTRITKM